MARIAIACLQLEAHDLADSEAALDSALAMIDVAGKSHPDLMILPECTFPAYYLESIESYRRANVRPHDEVVRLFGERARMHRSPRDRRVGAARPFRSLAQLGFSVRPAGTYARPILQEFLVAL